MVSSQPWHPCPAAAQLPSAPQRWPWALLKAYSETSPAGKPNSLTSS